MLKRLFTLSLLVVFGTQLSFLQAQESESSKSESPLDFNIGADIMSRYIWRGTQFSKAPSIQPSMEIGYKGLAFGAWGAYSFDGMYDGAEADLYLSYTFLNDMVTATVTDYFFPDDNVSRNKYFNYDEDETGHILELSLSFNGLEDLPLSFLVATNVYGADAQKINDDPSSTDFNMTDGNQYSTYMELGYSFAINQNDLNVFMGGTISKPKTADLNTGYIGETGFYGNTTGVVNLGITATRNIEVTDKYAIPVQASFITNPMSGDVFFVFGVSF